MLCKFDYVDVCTARGDGVFISPWILKEHIILLKEGYFSKKKYFSLSSQKEV